MAGFEDKNYLPHYQEIRFREYEDDFKNAAAKRSCLSLNYVASTSFARNDTTCLLLERDLKTLSELVDCKKVNSVNNFSSILSMMTPRIKNTKPSTWTSGLGLNQTNPINLLTQLPHVNNCYTDSSIDKLKLLIENKEENNSYTVKKDQKPTPVLCSRQPEPVKPIVRNHFNSNSVQRPKTSEMFPLNNAHNVSEGNYRSIFNRNPKQENEPKANSAFRTARNELDIQNAKKYNSAAGSGNIRSKAPTSQPLFAYGAQKKSLGARRNVQSKFIPPDRNSDDIGEPPAQYDEEIVDERLRNIDPKMIELIRSEIMDNGSPITWDDIAGLEFAKTTIQEIVVWPLLRPDIFTGLRRPPKGILLFGPPGTGKTLIGKCIASQSQSTFFSISASSLTSKWIGDGEKMVRALFAVARCHQPAVIFIDEIDSLLTQRSETEHESSRRMKTEFLVQLDGAATGDEDRILIIGATNRPQELDEAARRRLVKRLYIPLPEHQARITIIERLMVSEKNILTPEDIERIANLSDGYSGADMKNLCAEASLGPIRSINLTMIQNIQQDQVRAIDFEDFKSALNRVRASVSSKDLEQYIQWDNTYGSGKY